VPHHGSHVAHARAASRQPCGSSPCRITAAMWLKPVRHHGKVCL
jgi:hypothetical protein